MTPDLTYLVWITIFCVCCYGFHMLLVAFLVNGMLAATDYKTPLQGDQPDWLGRRNRAHVSVMTAAAAGVFFWSRLARAVGYITGRSYVRTLTFSIGVFASLAIVWEILS